MMLGVSWLSVAYSVYRSPSLVGTYLRKWDSLRACAGPSVQYSRSNVTASSTSDAKTTSDAATGFFGTQYSLGRKFAVFAEAGLSYRHGNASSLPLVGTGIRIESDSHGWSTRSGVGAIFYFD